MMLINQSADQKTGNAIMPPVFASEETSRKRSQDDGSEASTTVIFFGGVEFLSQPVEGQSFDKTTKHSLR